MALIPLLRCLKATGQHARFSLRTQPSLLGVWKPALPISTSASAHFKQASMKESHTASLPSFRSARSNPTALQHSRGRAVQYDDFTTPEDFDKGASFEELGVTPPLIHAMKTDGITVPTLVQYESLPVTFDGYKHCIIHSETGTGKTLTFLLPAVQDTNVGLSTLVLVPTRELAIQMHYQAVKLARLRKNSKRVLAVYSGVDDDEIMSSYTQIKPNIVIGTPKKVLQLLESNLRDFISLRRLVIDEGDKILLVPQKRTTERKKIVRELHPRPGQLVIEKLLAVRNRRHRLQLICTSASASHNLQKELSGLGWGAQPEVISTSSVSKLTLPNTIDHCFIQCSSPDQYTQGHSPTRGHSQSNGDKDKNDSLSPSLEFANDSENCSGEFDQGKVGTALGGVSEQGDLLEGAAAAAAAVPMEPPGGDKLETLVAHFKKSGEKSALVFIHRGAPIDRFVHAVRKHNLATTPLYKQTTSSSEYSEFLKDFKSGRIQLAVATEETVRGLDFSWLDTVYVMEVPRDACEYLHLCGRVGRVGRRGRAVVLLDTPQETRRLAQHYRKVRVEGTEIKL